MMPSNNQEIEHRFLLSGLPKGIESSAYSIVKSKHLYLVGNVIQERFSKRKYIKDNKKLSGHTNYRRTVKIGHGLTRLEFKEKITRELYREFKKIPSLKKLKKKRFRVKDSERIWKNEKVELIWEIDEFLDRELFLAEVEIPSEDYEVIIPKWLFPHIITKVTDECKYEGASLAR